MPAGTARTSGETRMYAQLAAKEHGQAHEAAIAATEALKGGRKQRKG